MENGEAVERGDVQNSEIHWRRNELASPVIKRGPALPPLIKIANNIPVGYSTTNTNKNNSEPNSVNSPPPEEPSTMPGTTDTESPHNDMPPLQMPQYRPTVISLNTHIPVINTNTSPTHNHEENHTSPPRPLVPPPEGERPERMRDWLVRMINSGRIPGLRWLDEDKMIFRVPWIHAKKRDYNQERDAALFREWAIHSGKYGDGSDVTTWKINFRCALNGLKDIIERRELEEPDCRVYQMLPSSSTGRRRKRRRVYYPSDYQPQETRPRLELTSPVTTPTFPLTPTTAPGTPIQVLPIVTAGTQVRLPIVASPTTPQTTPTIPPFGLLQGLRPVGPTVFHPNPFTHSQLMEQKSVSPLSKDGSNSQPATPRTPLSPQQPVQPSPKVISSVPLPLPRQETTNSSPAAVPSPHLNNSLRVGPIYCPPQAFCSSPSGVTVRILYGSITVHMDTIDCSQGARIFYGPLHCRDVLPPEQEEKLFGPLKAHQIQLTPRHPAGLAKDIFSNIKRGLILEVENGCIYATALCRAVVYYGSSPVRHSGTLAKEERTKVFNYTHRFLPCLKYTADSHGTIPKPYVIFSLGQPWGAERPLSKNLVTIVVTYCRALNDIRVRNSPIHDELLFEAQEAKDIRIISPTPSDLEAEQFLNPGEPVKSP